jgi:hypothetical protein
VLPIDQTSTPMNLPEQPAADAPIAEWAGWCADLGRITGAFKVFPCRPGEKMPLHTGWQQSATDDRKTIEAAWLNHPKANIGLAIQPGFVAIDGDLYKEGKEAALVAYEAKHGELPRTLEFRSARGGVHLIYSTDRILSNSRGTLPDFGDVRGQGGLIVGPGSYFEGLRYGVDNLAVPAALPSHVASCLVARRSTAEDRRELPQFVELDDPQNIERFTAWLKTEARPSVEGQGGNSTLTATGAMGSSYALSWDVTLQAMLEHWNPRCEPLWDDDVLEKHGGSGYRSANSQFGNMASRNASLMFEAQARGEVIPLEAKYGNLKQYFESVLSSARKRELRGKLFSAVARDPAPKWIIQGWRPQGGVASPFGDSGSGKTYIAIHRALCVATGTPYARREDFAGFWVGPARPVVIFAGEDPEGVKQRINAAIQGGGFDRALAENNLIFVDTVYAINRPDGLAAMAEEIEAQRLRPALCIIDTWNLALDGNDDAADEAKKGISGTRALAVMFDMAVEIIDHTGHVDKARQRGTSAKKGNLDVTESVTRKDDVVRVEAMKLRGASTADKTLAFRSHEITLTNPDTGDVLRHPDIGQPITDLWFEPIDPSGTRGLFEDQTGDDNGLAGIAIASAKDILDRYPDTAPLKAGELAARVMAATMPDLTVGAEPEKYAKEHLKVRKWLVRGFMTPERLDYVDTRTSKGTDASTFRNPGQNGRKAEPSPGRRQRVG